MQQPASRPMQPASRSPRTVAASGDAVQNRIDDITAQVCETRLTPRQTCGRNRTVPLIFPLTPDHHVTLLWMRRTRGAKSKTFLQNSLKQEALEIVHVSEFIMQTVAQPTLC